MGGNALLVLKDVLIHRQETLVALEASADNWVMGKASVAHSSGRNTLKTRCCLKNGVARLYVSLKTLVGACGCSPLELDLQKRNLQNSSFGFDTRFERSLSWRTEPLLLKPLTGERDANSEVESHQ